MKQYTFFVDPFDAIDRATLDGEGWVSVEDRLPESHDEHGWQPVYIFCAGQRGAVVVHAHHKTCREEFEPGFYIGSWEPRNLVAEVTHWMSAPLPAPPKEGER